MRHNWLESKIASVLFFSSVVVCLSCFAFALSLAAPWVRDFLNSSSANELMGDLFFALVVLTIPCSLIVSFGMAIFCAFTDHSPVGTKVGWFLLFFVTWPFGSMVYFFRVYRLHIKKIRNSLRPALMS
jgi:hypothetical protein